MISTSMGNRTNLRAEGELEGSVFQRTARAVGEALWAHGRRRDDLGGLELLAYSSNHHPLWRESGSPRAGMREDTELFWVPWVG